MKKRNKKIIRIVLNTMFYCSIGLFTLSIVLLFARVGFSFEFGPPFCWASFLQTSLLMLTGWAFNKELFYY